jgi:hypothetical protein
LLNSFAVMRALMFQQELESLDAGILLRLVVLQVQYPELYMELTRQPKLLIALEQSYQGKINPHNDRDFTDFEDSKSVQEFCKRYWRPTSVLSGLFSNSTFQQMESSLITYMTMLGEKRAEG